MSKSSNLTVKNPYQESLVSICDRITTFFGWNLRKEEKDWEKKGSRRITSTEDLRKAVYKAKMEVNINYGRGIASLYDLIPTPNGWGAGWRDLFGYSEASDFTLKEIEEQREFALIIYDLVQLYNDWKKNEFNPAIGQIKVNATAKEKKFEITPSILEAINKLVFDEKFKAYKYKDTGENIGSNDVYYISEVIGFSGDLTLWLNHVQNQQEFLEKKDSNEIFVTMFGKLDEVHPLYSNWLFTLHKKGTIWIITDQVEFDNPHQKHAQLERKSVWRDRGEMYYDCDLPYEWFHDMKKLKGVSNKLVRGDSVIREKFNFKKITEHWNDISKQEEVFNKMFKEKLDALNVKYDVMFYDTDDEHHPSINAGYAKFKGNTVAYCHPNEIIIYKNPEFFFKYLKDLKAGQYSFVMLLIKEMVQYLSAQNTSTPVVMLASEFVNTKMIEGATINASEPTYMEYWEDEQKKIFGELLETIEDKNEKSTALTLHKYELVFNSKYFNASWLSTPEKLASLSEWMVLEDEANKLYEGVYKLRQSEDEANEWLNKVVNEDYDGIVKRMTIAKDIIFQTMIWDTFDEAKNGKIEDAGYICESVQKGVDSRRRRGIGKVELHEEYCKICSKHKNDPPNSKSVKTMHIRHYKEMMWLLGFDDRNKLHKYFRQFRAHNLIPYSGNSNLEQTHPYLRIEDPCSDRYSNGIIIHLYMCGQCYRKIKQEKTLKITY